MQFDQLKRREFVTLLGGVTAGWPLTARAQQAERMRRIGVLMSYPASDRDAQALVTAFMEALQQLGWTDGRNVRIDTRWAGGSAAEIRKQATELVAIAPDVVLVNSTPAVGALLQTTTRRRRLRR